MAATAVKASSASTRAVDLLTLLGRCPDRTIFFGILLVRLFFLAYMIGCRRLMPILTRTSSEKMTVFDTSSTSDPSDPFPEVTRWDVVHFYHIATYGYTHEANFAFFPFMPMMIRGTTFVTQVGLPFLGRIASVPVYLSALSMCASATAGVLLRRITTLTVVGKEGLAIQRCSPLGPVAIGRMLFFAASAGPREASVSTPEMMALSRILSRRWQLNAVGTSLDALRLNLEANKKDRESSEEDDGGRTPQGAVRASRATVLGKTKVEGLLGRRWRFVGATALAWIMTPSMVFTVALYTESVFAVLTLCGVYCLIVPSAAEQAELSEMVAAESGTHDAPEDVYYIVPDDVTKNLSLTDEKRQCVYHLRQRYLPSLHDIFAVILFFLTATIRSNGFVHVGFLWYPLVLQVLWPEEFQWRWRLQYGAKCHRLRRGAAIAPKTMTAGTVKKKVRTAHERTVRLPTLPTRWPHPIRLLWLCLYTAVLLIPSLTMNKVAYTRFYHLLTQKEKEALGGRFWRMYAHIQAKYWDCGLFHAYTVKNSPNVVIALPVGSLVVAASVLICRGFWQGYPRATSGPALRRESSFVVRSLSTCAARCRHYLRLGLQSSNLTLLWVLTLVAFTVMHIHVVNRFVMVCPALHWLFAYFWVRWPPQALSFSQLLRRRRGGEHGMALYGPAVSFVLVAYMILWNLLGGYMFPNHLPWT